MKLLLQKCQICANWYRPCKFSNHCPTCGAAKLVNGIHIDTATNKVIVKGLRTYSTNQNRQLQIARILAEE